MNIKWYEKPSSYAEIYNSGLQFSFISDENEQCFNPVYCKDFLHDAVRGQLHNKAEEIWGFTYNPKVNPNLSLTKTRLLVVNKQDESMMSKIEGCLDFINQLEKDMGFKAGKQLFTKVITVDNPKDEYKKCGAVVFEGSRKWMLAPPLLSLYTLMLRVGMLHTKGTNYKDTINSLINESIKPYQSNDKKYTIASKEAVEKIIELGYQNIFEKDMIKNYPAGVSIGTFHDSFGICNFVNLSKKTSSDMPDWKYDVFAKKQVIF